MPWTCPTCAHVFDVWPSRPVEAKAEAGVPLAIEMSALAIHLRDIGCPGESMDLQEMADRVRSALPAPADALREAVRYALDVFSQYDGKHIMQALQFTDHIKKMAAALAERPVEGEKK